VPSMLKRFGDLKQFLGQGVEKNNDDGKRHYFSSNRHDAAAEIVRADERLEILRADWQRGKRHYRKRQSPP